MRRILTFALLTAVALSGCKKGGGDGPESTEPVTKSVTVGTQSGTVTVGTSGSATFPVTTSGIANGTAARLEFYLDSNGKEGEEVTGFMADYLVKITATVTNISSGGSATATISYDATDGYAAAGNYPFRIIADDVRSDVKTFVLSPADAPAKTITVGTQHGTMTAGTAGTVTYAVETTGYAAGDYVIQGLRNFPTDVSLTNDDVITIGADGKGTLTLEGGTNTTQGTTSDLQISWGDSVWSNNFSLTISPAATTGVPTAITSATWNADYSVTFTVDGDANAAIDRYQFQLLNASTFAHIVSGPADYEGSLSTSGSSATISAARVKRFMTNVQTAGNHIIKVYLIDNDFTGYYAYTEQRALSPVPELANPTNLRWEGGVAKWDAVPNANSYGVEIAVSGSTSFTSFTTVSGTQYDFNSAMTSGKTYYFRVYAADSNSNYRRSGATNSGTYTKP